MALTDSAEDAAFADYAFEQFLARLGNPEVIRQPHFTRRTQAQARGYWRAAVRIGDVSSNLVMRGLTWSVASGGESFPEGGKSIMSLEYLAFRHGLISRSALSDYYADLAAAPDAPDPEAKAYFEAQSRPIDKQSPRGT